MLTAALAVLCALLVLVLLVQRPAIWPVLVVLAVLSQYVRQPALKDKADELKGSPQ